MAYLEALVAWGVFKDIMVTFLPIGHTHEDIDQCFSVTSRRLHDNNAITLEELYEELRHCYNSSTVVNQMKSVINFSGLCDQESCLHRVQNITSYRYFRLTRTDLTEMYVGSRADGSIGDMYRVRCVVKAKFTDEWQPLHTTSSDKAFLSTVPSLLGTSPLYMKEPDGKAEVVKRIVSEETRINSAAKYESLMELCDTVFQDTVQGFQWDLRNSFEVNTPLISRPTDCVGFNTMPGVGEIEQDTDDLLYDLHSFVAVKADMANSTTSFWIGQVQNRYYGDGGKVEKLGLHWFEPTQGRDKFTAVYRKSFLPGTGRTARVPWTDDVTVASVLIAFGNLTRKNKLSVECQKKLRDALQTSI